MNVHQVTTLTIVIGGAGILLGIAEVVAALLRRDRHIVREVIIGVGFILVGILIVALSRPPVAEYRIDLGPLGNSICGALLLLFVFGMFILRAAMNVQEGRSRLKGENLSTFAVWRSKFEIVMGIIMIVWFAAMLLLFLSQALK